MKNITLKQFLENIYTNNTVKSYLFEIENFKQTNPKARWYKLEDILQYLETLSAHYNESTQIRKLNAIKRYYDYLIETGSRADHPCNNLTIKGHLSKRIQTQKLFSMEELMKLFSRENRYKNLEKRNKVILSLLIYQALTSTEIIELTLENIDLDSGTIHIKPSKTLHGRTLEMHRTQLILFDSYINKIRTDLLTVKTNKLIIGKLGKPMTVNGIYSIILPLKMLYPDRVLNLKTIRQSVISYWLNDKKLSLENVQQLCGHKFPSSTENYKKKDGVLEQTLINKYHPLEHLDIE